MTKITTGRFTQHLDMLQDQCLHNDLDSVGLITGPEGSGKSGLAYVANRYLTRRVARDFNAELQFHWGGGPYMAASRQLEPGMPITLDELVRDGSSYNFMSEANRNFASYLSVCRERNLLHWLVNPSKRWTSPVIKEHRAFYEYPVVRRYREHAVAKVMQLRDEDEIFQRPRHLFTFSYPKPRGAGWREVLRLKRAFGDALADNRADEQEIFKVVKMRMQERLAPILGRL